ADIPGTDRAKLTRSFKLKIPISLTDIAPRTQSKSMSPLSSGGAIEGRRLVVNAEIVEIEVHRQEVRRPGAVDAEELLGRGGRVGLVRLDDYMVRPEGVNSPIAHLEDASSAVEGAPHVGVVAHPHQPLVTEYQLLSAATQGQACLVAQWNHDIREAVLEGDRIHERVTVAPLEVSV